MNSRIRSLTLLIGQSFCMGFATSVFYTVANTLFLTDYGSDYLPFVYLTCAVVVSVVSLVLLRLERIWPLSRVAATVCVAFCLLPFGARALLGFFAARWVSLALMVSFTLLLQLSIIILGAQAGQIFDLQQMKRSYPLVMAGQVLGVVIGGALVGPLASMLGSTHGLLYVAGSGMAGAMIFVLLTAYHHREQLSAAVSAPTRRGRTSLLRSDYVRTLLAFQLLVNIGSNLVNYLFLDRTGARYHTELELTQFFGTFMAAATLLTLVFLAVCSAPVLVRFGVGVGAAANPVLVGGVLVAAVAVVLAGSESGVGFFALILTARFVNFVVVTGLSDPAVKTALQPLKPHDRVRAQTISEGVIIPLAMGTAGLCLLVLRLVPRVSVVHIAGISAAVMAGVTATAVALYRRYRRAVAKALTRRGYQGADLVLSDRTSLAMLRDLLKDPDASRVLMALELLDRVADTRKSDWLVALTAHANATVRATAWGVIEQSPTPLAAGALPKALLHEHDPAARAALIRAGCALFPADVGQWAGYLDEEDVRVSQAAAVGLLRSCGIPGALAAGRSYDALHRSLEPADKVRLARLIGEVGDASFYLPLVELLSHRSLEVRIAALEAAGKLRQTALLAAIVENLRDVATRSSAVHALTRFGNRLLPLVGEALASHDDYPESVTARLVRVCGQIGGEQVRALLRPWFRHARRAVAYEVLRSLSMCEYSAKGRDQPLVYDAIRKEAARARDQMGTRSGLPLTEGTQIVHAALEDEIQRVRRRVFLLLSFLGGGRALLEAEHLLTRGTDEQRALAGELVQVTAPRSLRSAVTQLVSSAAPTAESVDVDRDALIEQLRRIAAAGGDGVDQWTGQCAVYAIGQQETVMNEPQDMDAVVQKVIALKSISIFANTPSQALASVASIADEVDIAPGQTFIRKGDVENCMYVIVHGRVRVHDRDRTIAELGRGEIIGELSLLDPAPRSASVTALEDTELYRIEKDAFDTVMADNPEVVHGVIHVLIGRLRTQIARV